MESPAAVVALGALAQESRLAVFRLLVQAGADGLPAGRIAEALDLPAPTLSFHLAQLKQAGLVTFRREGRSLIYVADYGAMNGLVAYLMENCCQGQPNACAVPSCVPATASVSLSPKRGARADEAPARVRRR
jgi:DNA-binding transcriptional ArsR family regulator